MGIINLRQMDVDQTGVITSVKASGELGRRIREMDLVPGKDIMIQGKAPLYDLFPLESWGLVPLILFMFFGISFLEDSGYLARMAFMLDRVFRLFGRHGSSVMAFIVSGGIEGGCAVSGVMAARTLKSPKERLATLLTVPFMTCGAKLPVFALLVGACYGICFDGVYHILCPLLCDGGLHCQRDRFLEVGGVFGGIQYGPCIRPVGGYTSIGVCHFRVKAGW